MTTVAAADAGTWTVDAGILAGFAARNFAVKIVRGTIAVTAGIVEIGPDGRPSRLSGTLDPASIDTGNPRRDKDLRGKRFLDVVNHPRMDVVAEHIEPTTTGWRARAVLRVAGAEAPLWIDGTIDDASTAARLLVTGTARLDLRDVGIRAPRLLVGRWVELTVSVHLTRRPD
ncbi:YceI family protein [Dactylosporangium darangshiense]|uniref:YceI family protein n=1 Tax=Dactylosporangium darangshiense TaxID=579108 RepID=A0ABP8DQS5_9ACTN